ncbi:MAG: hypothetical protein ACI9UA_005866 [Pseudoalteromonas tetraodonis]|jgi:hypothetical protein
MYSLGNIGLVVGVAIAAIVIGLIAFFVVRNMKGKIQLVINKEVYKTGEAVSGTVMLMTKKPLKMRRLFVVLIGTKVVEYDDDDGVRQTRKKEIYRSEVGLEEAQQLAAGFEKTYQFGIEAPDSATLDAANGGSGGRRLKIGPISIGGNNYDPGSFEWRIEARADLPGVDLAKSKSVRINVS